jgi:hypothetical protein
MTRRLALVVGLACLSLASTLWAQQPVEESGTWNNRVTGNAGGIFDAIAGATAAANGQQEPVQQDQAANLLIYPGIQYKSGDTWTSSTSSGTFQYPTGTTNQGQLSLGSAILLQLDQNSPLTGGVVTLQGTYDNNNWITIPVSQVLNPTTFVPLTNPYTLVGGVNQPFLIVLNGLISVRADLSTAITGAGNVTPVWTSFSSPLVPPATGPSILAGQQAVTASAAALASNSLSKGMCVEALSTNAISVFLGPSGVTTSTGIELAAGASFCPAVSNSNAIYVIASTTGASVTWSGN